MLVRETFFCARFRRKYARDCKWRARERDGHRRTSSTAARVSVQYYRAATALLPTPATGLNLLTAATVNPEKITKTANCVILKGPSEPVGAKACRGGIF